MVFTVKTIHSHLKDDEYLMKKKKILVWLLYDDLTSSIRIGDSLK